MKEIKLDKCVILVEELRILIAGPERNLGIGRNNFKMYLKETKRKCGLDSSDSGSGVVPSSCEHGIVPSGSIRGENVPDE
jgi:hypothetical protein